MLSTKIFFLTKTFRPLCVSRTYRSARVKRSQTLKNDHIKGNPGGNRLLAVALDGNLPDVSDFSLNDIEDGENDMLNSHLLYDDHMKELQQQKQFKSFHNIKRKYFKNKTSQHNFLTYFEKQQIKNLHEKSPKEWTPETLSTCFPATPEIIVKILRSKWVADEGEKILRHDQLVQKNWETFRSGLFKDILPDELKNHLARFSDRRPTLITLEQAKTFIPKPASSYMKREEFGKIITSYIGELEPVNQKEQILKIEAEEKPFVKNIYEHETKTNLKKKHFTLDELNNNVHKKSFSWYTPQNYSTNEKSVETAVIEADLQENTGVISRKEVSTFIDTMNEYPLAIRIPKQAWKEGHMYKVKDCFYDDQGDFLFRVPGLTSDENR